MTQYIAEFNKVKSPRKQYYLIIDAGKGTTDFSIMHSSDNNNCVWNSLFRGGLPASGHALTFAVYEAVWAFFMRTRQKNLDELLNNNKDMSVTREFMDYLEEMKRNYSSFDEKEDSEISSTLAKTINTLGDVNENLKKNIIENSTLATLKEYTRGIFINKPKEAAVTEKYVNLLNTKTPGIDQLVMNLSGGNQQKVVIAKWLVNDSQIMIFDEPTRGIDVGAKQEIYELMNRLAESGKAIIMISSELAEILRMSDRIIVMCEGRKTGEFDIAEATQEKIMNAATRDIDLQNRKPVQEGETA